MELANRSHVFLQSDTGQKKGRRPRKEAPARQARVENDVVADGELEHVEAQLPGEVEVRQVGVRPAPGEEITVGPVFHDS